MSSLSGMRVLVAGGGAVGSAVALAVRRAGARVVLADPAALGDNASGVAAGMLAPAFEAALDPASAGHFDLYRQARDLWPAFAASLGAIETLVHPCGALWAAADEESREAMLARLRALGAAADGVSAHEAARLSPGLAAPAGAVFTPEDWRLEPGPVLAAMRAALAREGVEMQAAALTSLRDGAARADAVVLATGMPPLGVADPPSELGLLTPIKGQILRAAEGPRQGPVVRATGIYVAPGAAGAWLGATMEAGLSDRAIDEATTARLHAAAAALFPALEGARVTAAVGVRAATPDGLPLVGASAQPGVVLALGARRNGWLLAPMIAAEVVRALAGLPVAARFDARRFVRERLSAGRSGSGS